ncbi:S8/S53 family peptidase [Actinoplanes sp. NBRC 103695]|uniref:S8 family peptidase n=1 Tax=Actinoplanes sp. NBRC 103695 TaxID=3032202 RepID=UPI0024A4B914|nr:S8/S53 family peptidase [Actinoplanes sp. NBRC 103695]GLY92887.1 protease [Actinoplanes sp. NBRC 103695]
MSDERTDNRPETRQQAQLRLLRARFRQRGIDIAPGPAGWEENGVEYHYEPRSLLVGDQQVNVVQDHLRSREIECEVQERNPTAPGYRVMLVPGGTMHALREVDRAMGPGVASCNHLVHLSPGSAGNCPASEPTPVPPDSTPVPPVNKDRTAGHGVRVVVADTGLDPEAEKRSPWLRGVTGDLDRGILENPMTEYAGHGTFIAGVIRCLAPAAEVHVRASFEPGGAQFETELVEALMDILDNDFPDIINFSAGTWTHASRDLLTLQLFGRRRLRLHKGVLLVAAAGNDGQRQPFWPAAAPYAVSVGALDPTLSERADFSNFGGWVDVFAPGEDLINAFPVGTYIGEEPPNKGVKMKYKGMAKWSGTSFATPVIAGMAAARMSKTGENGVAAAESLIKQAQDGAIPGLGAIAVPLVNYND